MERNYSLSRDALLWARSQYTYLSFLYFTCRDFNPFRYEQKAAKHLIHVS